MAVGLSLRGTLVSGPWSRTTGMTLFGSLPGGLVDVLAVRVGGDGVELVVVHAAAHADGQHGDAWHGEGKGQ